jgi:membrane protease YdiL (CAAX protease family)
MSAPAPVATPSRRSTFNPRLYAGLVAVAFVVATLLVRIGVEVVGAVVIVGWLVASGATSLEDLGGADPATLFPVPAIATLTMIELAALGAVAAGFAFLLPPARDTLAIRGGRWTIWPIALVGGFTVGTAPGWMAERLTEWMPDWMQTGTLELLAQALANSSLLGQVLMGAAVVVFAPLFEELVFRGLLWGAISRAAPQGVAWAVTTLLFAAYHLDPIHVLTVLPIGAFIGWVRWTSGSIGPAILVHFLNNSLAAALSMLLPADTGTPWWVALVAATVTLVVSVLAFPLRGPPFPTRASVAVPEEVA